MDHRYYQVLKTTFQMLNDRGYSLPDKYLEDFKYATFLSDFGAFVSGLFVSSSSSSFPLSSLTLLHLFSLSLGFFLALTVVQERGTSGSHASLRQDPQPQQWL